MIGFLFLLKDVPFFLFAVKKFGDHWFFLLNGFFHEYVVSRL